MVRQNKQTKIKNNYFLIWEKNKRILYSRGYQMTISNKINDNCSLKSSDSNSVLKDVVAVKAETVTDYIINKESYEIGQNQIVPNFIVYLKKYADKESQVDKKEALSKFAYQFTDFYMQLTISQNQPAETKNKNKQSWFNICDDFRNLNISDYAISHLWGNLSTVMSSLVLKHTH